MILQAYDFVELSRRYGCNLQMGGSDQWGNIVNGVDLGRRMGTPQLYALTCPLLTTASGAKMGKTAAGAVWLNEDMLSPYDYWQFWRNTEDADVGRFLKLFTTLPLDEIARLAALRRRRDQRGQEGAGDRGDRARARPRQGGRGGRDGAQDVRGGRARRDAADHRGAAASESRGSACSPPSSRPASSPRHGEARRQIQGGGLRVNDVVVTDEKAVISTRDLTDQGVAKLSMGRKRHVLARPA